MRKKREKTFNFLKGKNILIIILLIFSIVAVFIFFGGKIGMIGFATWKLPTPPNDTTTTNASIEINISITEANLDEVKFNWNGTNYTMYNDSLVFMMNFDNVSALDENDTHVVDVSGYGNNGTVVGGNFTTPDGKYGRAMMFDGIDDYVNVSDDDSLDVTDAVTIEAWIKPRSNFSATGGTVTYSGNYTIHTFTQSGKFEILSGARAIDVLIVGGGGGGGGYYDGGGGAGGLIYKPSHCMTEGIYTVMVGIGGPGYTGANGCGTNGQNSTFDSLIAIGGGAGCGFGLDGGSGGGDGHGTTTTVGGNGTQPYQSGDSGVYGFGYPGGGHTYSNPYPSGGGGGAGAKGGTGWSTWAGPGGVGKEYLISGTAKYYAGGGGGGWYTPVGGGTFGVGGAGGGGRADATGNGAGTPNTGGGGGAHGQLGNGGSGIVIIRYLTQSTIIGKGYDSYQLDIGGSNVTGYINNQAVSTFVEENKWHHIALSYDKDVASNQQKLYVNGVLKIQETLTDAVNTNSANLTIGNLFDGEIDEVRIWNRSLSTAEIQQQYMSNLNKYDIDEWLLYVNENYGEPLGSATHTYCASSKDTSENENLTEIRYLNVNAIIPQINFTLLTPANGAKTTNTSIEINVSIIEENLDEVIYNWNGTNYTMYNDSLVFMMNFDNVSALGENNTHVVDVNGYENNGTIIGGNYTTADGKYGRAMMFDGGDDYIQISNDDSLNINDTITIEAWVKQGVSLAATGGTITHSGNYTIHTFTSNGAFTPNRAWNVEVLVVGGGGGGGGYYHGGGGAGGLIYMPSFTGTTQVYNVVVGAGGSGGGGSSGIGTIGGNSTFSSLTALGGGTTYGSGGSGGGRGHGAGTYIGGLGTQPIQSGDSGTYGFGNFGGGHFYGNKYPSGGGGGAGAAGARGVSTAGGAGGAGKQYSISGSATYYAGGGGGGWYTDVGGGSFGSGGVGGGGNAGTSGSGAGTANTGGGGGAHGINGDGGSGIVIIRYSNLTSIIGKSYDSYQLSIDGGNVTGYINSQSVSAPVEQDEWQYIVLTYNGSSQKLYINGEQKANASLSGEINTTIGNLLIGNRFNGFIDEIKIWNRSLSATEIYQQYKNNLNKYDTDKWSLYMNQSKNLTAELDYGVYTYQTFTEDEAGNVNQTEERIITLQEDIISPVVNLISPTNNAGDSDGNVIFNYNVSDANDVTNCSLIFNGQLNKTNLSIAKDATINFTLSNLNFGIYTWSINCTDEFDNVGESDERSFSVALSTEFSGDTTDFSGVDMNNIINLIIDQPAYGKISFNEEVNLSSGADLDAYVDISSNRIELDSTTLSALDKSATLYLYNLTFTNPRILKDGAVCPTSICTKNSYSGGTLNFTVTSFSVYSAEETPSVVGDTGDGGGGGTNLTYECSQDSDCKEDESCWNHRCVKLFDIKILEFESPIKVGEFFDFTYFVKGVGDINDDVTIDFWIEKDGEIVTFGYDVIFMGSNEEKTESTSLFMPSEVDSGIYKFVIKVSYGTYTVSAARVIEIEVKDGLATIKMIPEFTQYIIYGLIGLCIFIVLLIFYIKRKKVKTRKISILIFLLFIIFGVLAYYFKLFNWVTNLITSKINIFPSPGYYILGGIALLIFIIGLIILIKRKSVGKIKPKKRRKKSKKILRR